MTSLGGNIINNEHPGNGDIRKGEALIKKVYETIRNSPIWDKSALVLMYDEHGGLYDHVPPPSDPKFSTSDDDTNRHRNDKGNHNEMTFNFQTLGVRIPAVVISPYVHPQTTPYKDNDPRSKQYDHTSLVATIQRRFGLSHLSNRAEKANDLSAIFALNEPRKDTPSRLNGLVPPPPEKDEEDQEMNSLHKEIMIAAAGMEYHLSKGQSPTAKKDILAKVSQIKTKKDAIEYQHTVLAAHNAEKEKKNMLQWNHK